MRKTKNRKGFTLIELVVVMVILGVLALIIVPQISGYRKQAQIATCEANQRIWETTVTLGMLREIIPAPAEGGTQKITAEDVRKPLVEKGLAKETDAIVCPVDKDGVYSYDTSGNVTCSGNHQ